jgi:acyl-CoA dehydrogenase
MFDPEKLLGEAGDLGITCALIPRNTPGVTIGRRHFPLNVPFQNGPLSGKDVFVPLDFIIGGPKMAGQGWRMLVEQLSVGRCISLPSNTTGGSKAGVFASGAYTRIRRQFNMSVGRCEGVEAVLARMVGYTYTMDAARSVTAGAIDGGEKPSVPSAMLKYHVTEMGRQVSNDAMDVHGGKGIQLGPRNYLGRNYQVIPVAITVEGANILTRSLIIFGQGAIRCHPFVLKEMNAARAKNVDDFDGALFGHVGFTFNAVRSCVWRSHALHVPGEWPSVTTASCGSPPRSRSQWTSPCALGGYLEEPLGAGVWLSACTNVMVLKHHENRVRRRLPSWNGPAATNSTRPRTAAFLHLPNHFSGRDSALAGRARLFSASERRASPAVLNPTEVRDRLYRRVYRTLELAIRWTAARHW